MAVRVKDGSGSPQRSEDYSGQPDLKGHAIKSSIHSLQSTVAVYSGIFPRSLADPKNLLDRAAFCQLVDQLVEIPYLFR